MLSSWGVAFEPVNVHGDAEKQAELARLGVPRVPATVLGERVVHGWNPRALADLVGVDFDGRPALSPAELAQSLDNILYTAQHLARRLDARQLALKHPGRDRTLLELTFHLFRLSVAFVEALEQHRFPMEWLTESAGPEVNTGEALAAYGQGVRRRLARWFAAAPQEAFATVIPTYYGDQDAHLLLERTAWHAGQHLRQVYDLLERDGSRPGEPVPPELFEGLPMPGDLW